jgi:hypothetical protein
MKLLILALACLTATGCASWEYNPIYRFNEIVAVNLTGDTISEVEIAVLGTADTLSCQSVNQFAICQKYFGAPRYPGQGLELSWTQADGQRNSTSVNPSVPAYFVVAFPLRIVLEINPDGSVKSFFEQDERGDGPFIGFGAEADVWGEPDRPPAYS